MPTEGHADGPGWGKRPQRLLERMAGAVAERAERCDAGALTADPTGKPIWCTEACAGELLSLLMAYTRPSEETVRRAVATSFFREFVHGEPGTPDLWPIAALTDDLMALLGVRNRILWLSRQTLDVHLRKHPEIGAEEHALIPMILEQGMIWRTMPGRFVVLEPQSGMRMAIKAEKNGQWGWVLSLVRSSKLKPPSQAILIR